VDPKGDDVKMQSVLGLIYPPQCVTCSALVDRAFSLCGPCWKETPFIAGLVCDACGTPLPGTATGDNARPEYCDDCLRVGRPWIRGRAAMLYQNNARKMVLALKHGDRLDLAKSVARWMAHAAGPILNTDTMIVPIPIHRRRLLSRKYNQAALLSHEMARHLALPNVPDALIRTRKTAVQDGMSLDERFTNMQGAIAPHPARGAVISGRSILLVDDVMTSGATFASATHACYAAGASQVCVMALARVAKTP